MTWHGWAWDVRSRRWKHVCAATSLLDCAHTLERIEPRKDNRHHALTGGQVPDWIPGKLCWEE